MRSLPVLLLASCLWLPVLEYGALTAGEATPTSTVTKVDDFSLLDHRGEFQQLSRHSDAAFIVLFSFATGCPIVRQNIVEVQAIAGEYASKGVRVVCIDSSPADDRKAVQDEGLYRL